ncbi:hypothetical protein YC2023_044218 [Brassica napus]
MDLDSMDCTSTIDVTDDDEEIHQDRHSYASKNEGTPRSVRDSHRKVRDSHDGLIIQRNMALFFSGGDRKELKLRVTGRIWKEQQHSGEAGGGGACIPNLS